ncbi:MAG: integration host factor subunit alpha [Deltaproteobacteria bacterium]|nr:integration host factor subunit alpha [Deltaproteobacteria bacterium]MBW2306210.1 integration host factor subunit alpha [Deltaproteobacteria bacterium]
MQNSQYRQRSAWRTMTKADIVEKVHEKVGFSKKESAEIVELVLEIVKETLTNGEKIKISGFGNFVIREKKPRRGRNPKTGDEIEISSRRVLTFRPSPILRKRINEHSRYGPDTQSG